MVDVLYEDNQIIVVAKPQNIPSQEDASGDKDMLTMVKEYVKEKYNKPGNVYIGLVHRLDRPTGGVMVFARTSKAAARLTEQIQNGKLNKNYFAVVNGVPKEKSVRLEHYLKKDTKNNIVTIVPRGETGAKYAELTYKVVEEREHISLLDVKLLTGRSHQIRVQLSTTGYPIFGDAKYNGDKFGKCDLALWAYKLTFEHPTTKKQMQFVCMPNEEKMPWKMFQMHKYVK